MKEKIKKIKELIEKRKRLAARVDIFDDPKCSVLVGLRSDYYSLRGDHLNMAELEETVIDTCRRRAERELASIDAEINKMAEAAGFDKTAE